MKPEKAAPPKIQERINAIRAEIAARHLKFEVGYTSVSDRNLADITGLKMPPLEYLASQVAHQNRIASKILGIERKAIEAFNRLQATLGKPKLPETLLRAKLPPISGLSFDWTALGKITAIKDQGTCGSCWVFAATAILESSVAIRYDARPDLSEQYILDDAVFGNCSGGWQAEALTEMMLVGTAKQSDVPYQGKKAGSRLVVDNPYRALIWGFVGNGIMPSITEIKEALLLHGPVAVGMLATEDFKHYQGGIFDEYAEGITNHVVAIVGWDDSKGSWRVKNSWGDGWGGAEQGFAWIAYGSNSIGMGAVWVEALNTLFDLPREILEWLEKAQKLAKEMAQEAAAAVSNAEREIAKARAEGKHAQEEAEKAAKDLFEKENIATEQNRILEKAEKEAARATNEAEKRAKKSAAKSAADAARKANAEAAQAKAAVERLSKIAKDKLSAAKKLSGVHLTIPPDPIKHLPHF